jgi:hypothetical protein
MAGTIGRGDALDVLDGALSVVGAGRRGLGRNPCGCGRVFALLAK